jgi:hypothetical protein
MMPIIVLNPTAESETRPNQLAPRLSSLQGRKLGVLDNRKANADRLFDLVETIVRERYAAEVVVRCQKPDFSRPAPKAMLQELRECDAVITGVGD